VRFSVESGNGLFEAFAPFPGAEWHHLAGTFDGSNLRLYIDGELVDTVGAFPPDYDTSALHFGHDFDYGTEASWLRGSIDDLRVYARALTPAEVATLAANP
jgi:hypothetical protein